MALLLVVGAARDLRAPERWRRARVTLTNKLWLALMHVTVGATLIPLLARTSPRRPDKTSPDVSTETPEAPIGAGGEQR